MSSNYGYKPSTASTFNQLIQQGVTVEEASTQSGVSTNASQYGFGTNSNAGAVIPGAGGTTNAAGLTDVPYTQSGTGEPGQQPAQASTPAAASLSGYGFGTGVVPTVPNTSAATVELPPFQAPPIDDRIITSSTTTELSPFQVPPIDDRIITSTPSASSGFGYGTGINNPSVAPVQAAEATTSPYAAFSQVQAVPRSLETVDPGTVPNAIVDPQQALQQRLNNLPNGIDAATSGLNAAGQTVTEITATDAPAAVEQSDAETARLAAANASVGSINNVQDPQQAAAAAANARAVVGTQLAQRQAVLEAQRKMSNNGDWRVRLSLAAGADYLYKAPNPGILQPLAKTGGVIFPYMPKIETSYKADYDSYSLTHSNYKGYFYKSSYTDSVSLSGTFTAQDTTEANYLLAVIHFFRSVTKMFYGQDAQRGAPPPLVYLTGLGEYQFSAHPCVVSSFTYSLPTDVDYIRANSVNVNGTNLLTRRVRQDLPTDPISGAVKRLQNLFSSQGINKGAISDPVAPPTLGKNNPTYVPTKLEISLTLFPMQTRAQVSQVFSLKSFANGDLIKGGFW
jgi:hypothetical protein